MVQENDYNKFLQLHEAQLFSSGVPQHFWQSLYVKLKNEVFDSSDTFLLLQIDYEDEEKAPEDPLWSVQVKCEGGVKYNDPKHIYLIDHAWTFRTDFAKQQLLQVPNLLDRLCNIMGVEDCDKYERVEKVWNVIWKYCQTYSIGNAVNVEDRLPVWYIMDELGSGIRHCDEPNFRTVPFVHSPEQITYTLLFPIKDVNYLDNITRDFAESIIDASERQATLLPWKQHDFSNIDFAQVEPDEEYFLSGHVKESLPDDINFEVVLPNKIKVYSEYNLINQFLTDNRFEIVFREEEADILWYTRHFKTYAELSKTPNKCVNQFPFENVLTIKDLLSIICRRKSNNKFGNDTLETEPVWFPITYNLKTEFCKFVSYFQNRLKLNLDNHWICKPWNLARSLDTHITDNLDYIVRLRLTGPKIVQKYIHDPVLFYRPETGGKVKFDVRYVILLKSVRPLKAYAYKNFFLRFSNKPFELNDFHDYEKHFTVMNYTEAVLHHLPCAEFLKQWAEQYPNHLWNEIENKICKMLREVFEAAVSVDPPKGIAANPQSRAVYAVDLMLSWDKSRTNEATVPHIQPKLLEINWTPDCKRACDYYPNFYNDIFSCLFLNDEKNESSFICL